MDLHSRANLRSEARSALVVDRSEFPSIPHRNIALLIRALCVEARTFETGRREEAYAETPPDAPPQMARFCDTRGYRPGASGRANQQRNIPVR